MNIPVGVMLRDLPLLYSIGAAAAMLEPTTGIIWENISTGKQILEFIGDIPEWANFERNLEDNRESLNRKRTQLRCMEDDLIEEVETIELRSNGKRKREVSNWMKNVKAKTTVDDRTEGMERRHFVFRFLFRAWLGKCLKMEEEEVDKLIERRVALGSGLGLVLEPNNGTIQHRFITSPLVGKASSAKRLSIWYMLFKQKTIRILGLLGEKGMGKTTMMQHIYNLEIAESGLFNHAFYVTIEEGFDLRQLQDAIGEAMNLCNFKSIEDPSRKASRIKEALDKCGKYLLILDGLCKYFKLTEVGISIEKGRGKLVVVSRFQDVCRQTNCEKIIELERLPDDDAEELFMKTLTLRSPAHLSRDIQEIASKIIRKCGGVPSIIVETAESLRGVDDIHEWRVKARNIGVSV